jgi:hypothetical protein
MKSAKDKAEELINFHYNEIKKQCSSKIGANMYELAITFTIKHCEEMIQFIDSQTHHPFMKSYFEEVKKHSMDLGKLTPIIEWDKFDRCSRRLQHVLPSYKT